MDTSLMPYCPHEWNGFDEIQISKKSALGVPRNMRCLTNVNRYQSRVYDHYWPTLVNYSIMINQYSLTIISHNRSSIIINRPPIHHQFTIYKPSLVAYEQPSSTVNLPILLLLYPHTTGLVRQPRMLSQIAAMRSRSAPTSRSWSTSAHWGGSDMLRVDGHFRSHPLSSA